MISCTGWTKHVLRRLADCYDTRCNSYTQTWEIHTIKAGYNKVRYNEVPDIVKQIFGPSQNPLCHKKIVRYNKVEYNLMLLLVKQFSTPADTPIRIQQSCYLQ